MASKQKDYYDSIYSAAKDLGATDVQAQLAASQASLETGYGSHVKGNNHFGIKAGGKYTGKTVNFGTHEVLGGKKVAMNDTFRAYDGKKASVQGYMEFMESAFPTAWTATTLSDAVRGLDEGKYGKYATDPNYQSKVTKIGGKYGAALDTTLSPSNFQNVIYSPIDPEAQTYTTGKIGVPTPNPMLSRTTVPAPELAAVPTLSPRNPLSQQQQIAAPSIMPAQETIAQNWGSYRTPSMQESVARDSIAKGVDSIFSGLPSYDTAQQAKQDYSGTYGTFGRGLQDNSAVPSLPSDYASHRQDHGAKMAMTGRATTGAGVGQQAFSTNEGLLSSQPSFISSSLAQNMVTPQQSDLAQQYGMYTNPDAKAYYSAVDGSIPGVIGPNPTTQQDKTLLDPGVPVDDGPPKDQVFDDDTGLRSRLPGKKAVKQDRTPLAPEQRGILGGLLGKSPIGGLLGTNPVSNLASGLFSGLNSGFFSGGKSSVSPDTLAGIIGNAINATGRGDLTNGRGIRTSSSGLGTSVTGGPSANFDGYDAHTNNFGVTTVSNDNMSFIDNSDGGAAGGKVLCTHYHSIGWLSDEVYAADSICGLAMPDGVVSFYHSWAIPLVKQIKKRKWLELALWPPVKLWAFSMFLRYRNLSVNV